MSTHVCRPGGAPVRSQGCNPWSPAPLPRASAPKGRTTFRVFVLATRSGRRLGPVANVC
jgi:hypothetical protein